MAVDAGALADRIEAELRAVGSPERAVRERAYLKSDLAFVGASVPAVRRIARTVHRDCGGLDRAPLGAVVEALWGRGVHECRVAAVELLERERDRLTAADLPWLERLLREARTWALVDGLAVSVVGAVVEQDPAAAATLDRWATDEDFWLRRSALLALLPGVRRSRPDESRLFGYADRMLDEREFFVRKAIGWVLRELGKRDPDLVAAWLAPRIALASGVTVREAVKHLPAAQRDELLAQYRAAG